MSRVSVLESLYSKKKSALEFNYDNLWAPPIKSLLTQEDINELIRIATSLKYNGKINTKYKLIDSVMNKRGFRKAHSGTNRVVYNYLEDPRFVAKIAIDKVGMRDTPAEYKNQKYFAPFCCKIFEVDPSGVVGFVERVNPITSLEEFLSVADDIYNMLITKIIGKYVVDDIGTTKYMNFGLRMNGFGPVILDFPYAYELDGRKLICNKKIKTPFGEQPCGGEIDYDDGFNYLVCTKCGRTYQARDLANDTKDVLILNNEGRLNIMSKVRIVNSKTREIVVDDYTSTTNYVSKEEYNNYVSKRPNEFHSVERVGYTKTRKRKSKDRLNAAYYTKLMIEKFNKEANRQFTRTLDEALNGPSEVKVNKTVKAKSTNDSSEVKPAVKSNVEIVKVGAPKTREELIEKSNEEVPDIETPNNNADNIKLTDAEIEMIKSDDEYDNPRIETAVDTILDGALKEVYDEDNDKPTNSDDNPINEIDLQNFSIGQNVQEEEHDYSNYVPEQDEDNNYDTNEDDDVISYDKYLNDIKQNKKRNKHKHDKGMEEY